MTSCTTNVREAAKSLRKAQRAYMADRGNEALGKAVATAAEALDVALAATEPSMGDINEAQRAYDEAWRGPAPGDSMRKALDAVNFPALKAAGLRLYMAGKWSCSRPVNEARLWEDFRDALGLRAGTARRAGLLDDEPPLPFVERVSIVNGVPSVPVWGCGHDCRDPVCSGCKVVGHTPIPGADRPGVEL